MEIKLTEQDFACGQPISQGEVNIWMEKYAPEEIRDRTAGLKLEPVAVGPEGLILGHSETQHHHILSPVDDTPACNAFMFRAPANDNQDWGKLTLHVNCKLVHMRGTDTHKTFILPPGDYIRGIREEDGPNGWQRVAD